MIKIGALIVKIVSLLIQVYSYALLGYVLMSWVPNLRGSSIGQFLESICEPFLTPFRRIIPPIGMIDISPIVAFITLNLAQRGVYALYFMLA